MRDDYIHWGMGSWLGAPPEPPKRITHPSNPKAVARRRAANKQARKSRRGNRR